MSGLIDHITAEPPHSPPYVMENVARFRRRKLITFFGVDWMALPAAIIAPFWIAALGVAISSIARVGSAGGERLIIGLVYGLLMAASILAHQFGGAIAGALLGAPMRSVTFTATLPYNEYDESRDRPGRVHILRGLSEPLTNLAIGIVMFVLYAAGLDSHFLLFLAILNTAFFFIAMTPLPTMHGGVLIDHLKA